MRGSVGWGAGCAAGSGGSGGLGRSVDGGHGAIRSTMVPRGSRRGRRLVTHYFTRYRAWRYSRAKPPVIRRIRHKGLERYFETDDMRGVPAWAKPRLDRMLDRLDAAVSPADMNVPGWRFHAVRGVREGTYAVAVSGNLRLTFRFEGDDVVGVDLEDYH